MGINPSPCPKTEFDNIGLRSELEFYSQIRYAVQGDPTKVTDYYSAPI